MGLTIPLLENDGRALQTMIHDQIASTMYAAGEDQQNFICLNPNAEMSGEDESICSAYGWLKPILVKTDDAPIDVFVYPKSTGQPEAKQVAGSFQNSDQGFSSILGRVQGKLYIGNTAAGGEGDQIDLDSNGEADIRFSQTCQFILQLQKGKVKKVETNRDVTMIYKNQEINLRAYQPTDV